MFSSVCSVSLYVTFVCQCSCVCSCVHQFLASLFHFSFFEQSASWTPSKAGCLSVFGIFVVIPSHAQTFSERGVAASENCETDFTDWSTRLLKHNTVTVSDNQI